MRGYIEIVKMADKNHTLDNAKTQGCKVSDIYDDASFRHGVMMYLQGGKFKYDKDPNDAWQYERGRQFGCIVKPAIESGKTTLNKLFKEHKERGIFLLQLSFADKSIV
jgi:hypothetical protein